MQNFSGETMAHEARVRSHLARMEYSPTHTPVRRVRPRMGEAASSASGQGGGALFYPEAGVVGSRPRGSEDTATNTATAEAVSEGAGDTLERSDEVEATLPTFPWLNPGGLFTDTLSSVEV